MINPTRRAVMKGALIAPFALSLASRAVAQSYPTKPIKVVVAFGAGGVSDVFARQLGAGMAARLGQQIVVENRTGGNTIPATQYVTNSEPDGYTLFFTAAQPYALNPSFYKTLPYDPSAYTSIAIAGISPLGVQVPSDSPFKTLAELVKFAKENPGKLTCGSPNAASQSRMAMELFKSSVGIDSLHVPYTGSANMITAMIGRQIDWTLCDLTSSIAMIKAQRIRVLAVVADERMKILPDIPTLAEAGFASIKIPPVWFGMVAPPKTPRALVTRLHGVIAESMATPEMAAFLENFALVSAPSTPEELDAMLRNDKLVWGDLIKRLGLTLD